MVDEQEVDDIVDLKKEVMATISGEPTANVVRVLTIAICDVLMTTGPSLDKTLKVIETLKEAMTNVITDCDKAGVCTWNEPEKVQ